MGQVISEHKPLMSTIFGRILGIIVLLGVGVAGFFSINYLFPESVEISPYFQYVPLVVFLFGIIQFAMLWKLIWKRVVLYENGFGDGANSWAWGDITAYSARQINYSYMGVIPAGKSHHITLVMGSRAITMDSTSFNKVPEFMDYALAKISQLPKPPVSY